MTPSRDHLTMAYRSIECFSNDGKLDPAELQKILDIALADGVVDADERRVLVSIIGKLTPTELTPKMQEQIAKVRAAAGI
ncbi:MAG: hypothetical protein IV105_07420 [Rhizobacter sp.]|nr:hypothetical protein [Rhizobacter sp.]